MSHTDILLESGTNELEIVEFMIEESGPDGASYTGYYGMNVAKVLEIMRKPSVTELPEAEHACMLGAFNLRERIVPLIDLSIWLRKTMAPNGSPKVIVTEFNNVTNGFLVSGVNRIHRLGWDQVEPPGRHVSSFSDDCVTGVVRLEERIILLLDMERIVADLNPRLALREEDAKECAATSDKPVRVLFADDSAMIRKTLARGLTTAGFEVEMAKDGREAWDKLLEYKEQSAAQGVPLTDMVNILISDIEMPAMDGHNLTKRVKDDPVLKELPVILFSSLITDMLRHKGASVGADEQISKPDIQSLTRVTRNLLAERQGLRFD